MHRNTFIFLSLLAVFAALLIGMNVGKKLQQRSGTNTVTPTGIPILATPTPVLKLYTNTTCGIVLTIPETVRVEEPATGSAIITDTMTSEVVRFACEKEIPRIALPANQIETLLIGSISASLYHDSSPKDGTPIDALIFRNKKIGMDIFIAGLGPLFTSLIQSLAILP